MEPVIVAVLVGIAVYIVVVALIPRRVLVESTHYTRSQLKQLERESMSRGASDSISILREQIGKAGILARVFFTLPGAKAAYPGLLKAGMTGHIEQFFSVCLVILLLLVYALKGMGAWGVGIAVLATYLFAWRTIRRRIAKRNDAFLNLFPDTLDMIVRSVRSGYPLSAAVRMVADNMQPPVSTEFKQVADETAYGSSLVEALQRLSFRIDEPDVRFFVVMLTVQQEVGGNLSEVLSNLAGIIRKRKYLRMKIKALTSEGRATAWVLGLLPVAVAFLINLVAPTHLTPLFTTPLGHIILACAIGILLLGAFIVRHLVNMEI